MQPSDLSIPTLPSRSLVDTLAFYERLGFGGERPADTYAVLRRGTVEIHFFTHDALVPTESSAGCYIRVSDVDAVYDVRFCHQRNTLLATCSADMTARVWDLSVSQTTAVLRGATWSRYACG